MQPMDHPLKRYSGQIYYETRALQSLYDMMKLEQWTPDTMLDAIGSWEEEMRSGDTYRYKRRGTRKGVPYEKGDLKLDELVSGTWTLDQINEAIADTKTGTAKRNVIVF